METKDKASLAVAGVTVPSLLLGAKLAVRGRRLRSLQKLAPKAVTESADDFVNRLEVGDVLLFGANRGKMKSVRAKASTDLFRKSEGYYVHSAMYLGNGKIAHINPNKPPEIHHLSSYIKRRQAGVLAVRPKASLSQRRQMVSIAERAAKNKKLSYGGVAPKLAIFGDTRLERAALNKFFSEKVQGGKVICSSFISDIQRQTGMKHAKNPRLMTSIDFRSLKKPPVLAFKPKGMKEFKTSKFQGAGLALPAVAQGAYEYKTRSENKPKLPSFPKFRKLASRKEDLGDAGVAGVATAGASGLFGKDVGIMGNAVYHLQGNPITREEMKKEILARLRGEGSKTHSIKEVRELRDLLKITPSSLIGGAEKKKLSIDALTRKIGFLQTAPKATKIGRIGTGIGAFAASNYLLAKKRAKAS